MVWKLGILSIVAAALIFLVIPVRTHAVQFDSANPSMPVKWTFLSVVSNMYSTPGTIGLIAMLLAVAIYIALRIVRSS